AMAVKTPIAFLALLGLGGWLCWTRRARLAYLLPLAFSLGILMPAMTSHVNIGLRHVLPVYIGFSIMAAFGVVQLAQWSRTAKWAGAALALMMLWMVAAGAISHPDYLAYFNEFAGPEP